MCPDPDVPAPDPCRRSTIRIRNPETPSPRRRPLRDESGRKVVPVELPGQAARA